MMDVKALMEAELKKVQLTILLFGPALTPISADPFIASFQKKRSEIKAALTAAGHNVVFGEDFVDPTLPPPMSSPMYQEVAVMRYADLVIILVASPGSIAESFKVSTEDGLRRKTQYYCFAEHAGGFVVQSLQPLVPAGVVVELLPLANVEACHLTGIVATKVSYLHYAKTFLG